MTRWIMMVVGLGLFLPAVAGATDFTEITASGNCSTWNLDVGINWRNGVTQGDLDYTVSLLAGDGTVLETQTWSGTITHETNPQVYSFEGTWTGFDPEGDFRLGYSVHIVAPYGEELVDEWTRSGTATIVCESNPVESFTWSSVKALF